MFVWNDSFPRSTPRRDPFFCRAGCSAVLLFAFACSQGTDSLSSGLEFRGAAIAHVHRRGLGYGSGVTPALYTHLKGLGYNSVQLNTFAYQAHNQSTELFWNDPTLTLEDLAREIQSAHRAGFRVFLKPHIWVGGYDSVAHGQWRNNIHFENDDDAARWFSAYRDFLLPQARLAEREGVAAFAVGTELVQLTHPRYEAHWRELIRDLRLLYHGKLTYACEAWNAKNVPFWDELDAIGLDFYYRYPEHGPGSPEPNLDQLAAYYEELLRAHFDQARALHRPLWLTEVGFPSHENAIRTPHAWPSPDLAVDLERQSLGFLALGQALGMLEQQSGQAPQGIWVWKYTTALDGYEQDAYARGFNLRNKPAELVVARIFAGLARSQVSTLRNVRYETKREDSERR